VTCEAIVTLYEVKNSKGKYFPNPNLISWQIE